MEELRNKDGLTEKEFLAAYKPGNWPHPSVTADNVILAKDGDGSLYLLLIRRGNHPCMGMWALPGGFVDQGEPPYAAALRELKEETCLEGLSSVLLGVFGDPNRDPRTWTITCAYVTLVEKSLLKPKAGDDAAETGWFRLNWKNEGDLIALRLTKDSTELTAKLRRTRAITPLGSDSYFEILENNGLAFDHAKVIATAADRAEQGSRE